MNLGTPGADPENHSAWHQPSYSEQKRIPRPHSVSRARAGSELGHLWWRGRPASDNYRPWAERVQHKCSWCVRDRI